MGFSGSLCAATLLVVKRVDLKRDHLLAPLVWREVSAINAGLVFENGWDVTSSLDSVQQRNAIRLGGNDGLGRPEEMVLG